ncbi:Hypothetical predicted protein [Mytilus galloprovincialis]|uniref:Uncharacterized protein n=2 Tax=Mytilus galloprovincialis TaxID=29158 RepID=A0A8B6BKC8_MYTGA|nr:Hypothetical predicted protein [Mytilus galloprovincialis]
MNYSGPCFDNLETVTAAEQTHLQMNTMETKTKNKIAEAEIPPPKRKRISSQILEQVETNSQSQTSETEMTLSQVSDASVVQFSRLESLNNFLSICNVSPVKRLTNLLSESSKRTVRRYMDKTRQCFNAVAETISPNDGNFLFNSVQQQEEEQQGPCNELMKDIYLNAGSWQFRRQVLSIIVERMSFEEAQNFIPGLTAWRYYEAKKHTANVGVGLPVKELAEKRVKINIDSLEHFIDFVTSSHVIKDLPYGQKTLKLETGEVVTIPNVIRSLSSSALINQYYQLCEEDNISPLGKSTLYRILTECAASVRTSVEGLDNYVMEGSRAFQILEGFFRHLERRRIKKAIDRIKEIPESRL